MIKRYFQKISRCAFTVNQMFIMYGGGFDKIICHEYPLLCQIFKSLKINGSSVRRNNSAFSIARLKKYRELLLVTHFDVPVGVGIIGIGITL